MITFIIIAGYMITGMILTRLMLRGFWTRAAIKNYKYSDFEGPSGYVAALATTNFLFWPMLAPIHMLLSASVRMDPENLNLQLKAKKKELEQSHKYTNALERSNGMELTRWED